jgi:hypothetical protein
MRLRIELPKLASGIRIERDDSIAGSGKVQDVVDQKRSRLKSDLPLASRSGCFDVLARVIGPCEPKPANIAGVDLMQRRITRPARIISVVGPIRLGGGA